MAIPSHESQPEPTTPPSTSTSRSASVTAAASPHPGLLRAHLLLLVPLALATGFSMLFAPQSQLVLRLVCREHYLNHVAPTTQQDEPPPLAYCQLPAVQRQIATTSTLISLCSTIPNTLVGPLLGKLSDNPNIGRKPILALPILAELVNIVCYLAVFTYALPAWTLAVGALVMGLSGSLGTFLMAFFALATDQIQPHLRSYFFSIADGAMFVGMTIGPAVMAAVSHALPDEPRAIFWVAGIVFVLTFFVTMLVVHEKPRPAASHHPDPSSSLHSVPPSLSSSSRFSRILDAIRPLWLPWNRSRMVLFTTMALANLALTAHFVAFVPYTFRRYGWTTKENGYFQSTSFACKVVAVALFLPLAYRRHASRSPSVTRPSSQVDSAASSSSVHVDETHEATPLLPPAVPTPAASPGARTDLTTIRLALLSYAVTFVAFSMAPTGGWFLAAAPVDAVGILALPLQRSLLTHTATPATQGLVLGAAAALSGVAQIVGPLVFTGVYSASVGTWDGLVYVVGASVWVLAAALVGWVRPEELAHQPESPLSDAVEQEDVVGEAVVHVDHDQAAAGKVDAERQVLVEDEE